jgi:hypothetical protein
MRIKYKTIKTLPRKTTQPTLAQWPKEKDKGTNNDIQNTT